MGLRPAVTGILSSAKRVIFGVLKYVSVVLSFFKAKEFHEHTENKLSEERNTVEVFYHNNLAKQAGIVFKFFDNAHWYFTHAFEIVIAILIAILIVFALLSWFYTQGKQKERKEKRRKCKEREKARKKSLRAFLHIISKKVEELKQQSSLQQTNYIQNINIHYHSDQCKLKPKV